MSLGGMIALAACLAAVAATYSAPAAPPLPALNIDMKALTVSGERKCWIVKKGPKLEVERAREGRKQQSIGKKMDTQR